MITFYDDAKSPNTEKVRILLNELGLAYETKLVDRAVGDTKSAEYTAVNPNQTVPALRDGETTVWESGAILLYLADTHRRFLPPGGPARARVLELLFFEANWLAATLGGPGGIADQARRPEPERNQSHMAELMVELARQVRVLDRVLDDGREFLAGDYSIADMQIYPVVRRGIQYGVIEPTPAIRRWFERVGRRDAVKRASAAH